VSVQFIMRLVAGFSTSRLWFGPRALLVGLEVDKVALRQGFVGVRGIDSDSWLLYYIIQSRRCTQGAISHSWLQLGEISGGDHDRHTVLGTNMRTLFCQHFEFWSKERCA